MKILLSGGWGYGNLGDDALMQVSVSLMRKKFPNCSITLMTNDVENAKRTILDCTNIEFVYGMHYTMYGFELPGMLPLETKSFVGKIFNIQRIKTKISKIRAYKKGEKESILFVQKKLSEISKYKEQFNSFRCLCKGHDMYVMSGGGFLNRWHHMMISKYVEAEIAADEGIPVYLIGQTLGPFTNATRHLAKKIIKQSKACLFRDRTSILEFPEESNVFQDPIPDLALVDEYTFVKKNRIVVIPFTGMILRNKERFICELSKIKTDEIVFSISQLWLGAISEACHLYWYAKSKGLNATLCYSKNVEELQTIVGEASLVLSENLHGLILAYRAHTDIICMNDKRKFLTFMEMIGCPNRIIIAKNMPENALLDLAKHRMTFERHYSIRENICKMFNYVFKT